MQKSTETTTMLPQNPSNSNRKTHFPEPEKPFSSEINNSSESNNRKPDQESSQKSNETIELSLLPEKTIWEEKAAAAAAEDGGSSGRERLKRHQVEVAGRVRIPDVWGQEDLLKDWVNCTTFDASLVNSSIMSARDSLVEEGRRANSTRLRVQNGC